MLKKFLSVMVLAVGIIFSSQVFVNAAYCPIKGSNFSYESWKSNGHLTIRQTFVIENISNSTVFVDVDDFVFRKQGFNTVKPGHFGGGFSTRLNPPAYINSHYKMYPGDVLGVSLDYDIDDTTTSGWSLCYRNSGNMIVLATIK